jgi:hypothetical protein
MVLGVVGAVVRLHAVGGLCNRLQAILSHREARGAIEVMWDRNEYVSGAWPLDVFEQIPGVTFHDNAGTWDVEDHGIAHDAHAGWRSAYRDLRPVPAVQARIDKLVADLSPFDAIHVRRTDMMPLARRLGIDLTDDDLFLEWVYARKPRLPIYLATDNGETQRRYLSWLSGGVHIGATFEGGERQGEADHHRNGTLADAVVDLFVCARAREFLGSGFGSFSATIEILRGLR